MKRFAAVALFASAMTFAASASASYVCNLRYNPSSSSYGQYGSIVLRATSSPNCTGVDQGWHYFCTAGATSSSCTTHGFSEAGLIGFYQTLRDAQAADQVFVAYTDTCIGGAAGCWYTVQFSP